MPRKTGSSLRPNDRGPRLLMPHSQTIFRASPVAMSMSWPAPVVCSPNFSSSAMRPPMAMHTRLTMYSAE